MSALDQAFIKAYATAKPTPAQSAATSQEVAPETAAPTFDLDRSTSRPPQTSLPGVGAPMMDQLYADGALYRLDSPVASQASAIPPPHAGANTPGARRTARRLAHRAALQAASITEPQAALPTVEQIEVEPSPPPARPQRRLWTRSVAEVAQRLASAGAPVEENELSPEIVIQTPPKPLDPSHEQPRPVAWPPEAPLNVVVQPSWDPETAHWPSTPLTLFPESPDWLAGTIGANVEVDLAAMPEEPPARSARSFRLDASHTRPKPHKPPSKSAGKKIEKKVVEQILTPEPIATETALAPPAPSAEADVKPIAESTVDLTLDTVVDAIMEPAADAVASTSAAEPGPIVEVADLEPQKPVSQEPSREIPSITAAKKPCVPVWEVDRFLWPLTCEKLLQDEAYFAEAGDKLLAATRDGLKSLAITGSRRGEGRSTIALSLARSAAQTGLSVAVVDADFARPQLAEMIGLEVSHSWEDAALGKIPLSEAAIKSLEDRITVLPLEASAAGSSLTLADPRVTATLRALNATFDLVILDLGPLSPGSEALFPVGEACPVDAAVVVRDLRYASPSETMAIGQRLHAAGLEAVGIAENFVKPQEAAAAA